MTDLPFGFKRPKDSPGFLLWQTTVTWQRQIKRSLEPYNITHSQFVIMALLLWFEKNGFDTNQVLIVEWSKLDKMTVSKSIKNLVTQGLVSRVEHKLDTRAKNVTLTQQGKAILDKLIPIVEGIDAKFFNKVSIEEQESLLNILQNLAE